MGYLKHTGYVQVFAIRTHQDGREQKRVVADVVDVGRNGPVKVMNQTVVCLRQHDAETSQQNDAPHRSPVSFFYNSFIFNID